MSMPSAPVRPRSSRSIHPPAPRAASRTAISSSQVTTHTSSRATTAAQISASATSVKRNLFKSLRTAQNTLTGGGGGLGATSKEKKATRKALTLEESEEEEELSDEDVVERGENGEILLNMPEIIEIDEHEEADILERARMADSMNRAEAIVDKTNITEVLRKAVASLDDDNWMYEPDYDF